MYWFHKNAIRFVNNLNTHSDHQKNSSGLLQGADPNRGETETNYHAFSFINIWSFISRSCKAYNT